MSNHSIKELAMTDFPLHDKDT
ncbi:MAG TPA: carboxymuconolactone decarboxylase, partial [Marinobacter adhaerens]|nr:carboxymuconolactone decarboxylase [Marinobacter adhaerens]